MSRGAGFSDACEWRAPAFSAAPVDHAAIRRQASDAVDEAVFNRIRMREAGTPPLSDFPDTSPPSRDAARAELDARVPPGSDAPANPAPAPAYWVKDGEARPVGRTPVEEGPLPVGAASAIGTGDRPMTPAQRRAQLEEGQRRTAAREAYTAERLDSVDATRAAMTPDERARWDAPLSEYEREAVVDEMIRLETQGAERVEARIASLGLDPQGSGATTLRLQDSAMRAIDREQSVERAIAKVRSDRLKPSADTEPPPPGATMVRETEGETRFPVETRMATPEEQAAAQRGDKTWGKNDTPVLPKKRQSARAKALEANRKKYTDRTGAPDQREVRDGELMPPRARAPKREAGRDLFDAENISDEPIGRMTKRQVHDEVLKRFKAEYGRDPVSWIERADVSGTKPDTRVYRDDDAEKMNAIKDEIRREQPSPGRSGQSGRGITQAQGPRPEPYTDSGGPLGLTAGELEARRKARKKP